MKLGTRRLGRTDRHAATVRGLALLSATIAAVPAPARSQPDLRFSVRVYDYVQLPPGSLHAAESGARRIFNASGVDVVWLACLEVSSQSQPGVDQDCVGPYGGTTVVLRIVSEPPSAKATASDAVFGAAMGSAVASVFYGRLTELTHDFRGNDSEIPAFLGIAVAHELGHLLLGPASHSPTGVMCANWDWSRLHAALMGQLFFTAPQSREIRKEVLARTTAGQCQLAIAGKP
jgi:hypothetical protein